MSKLLKEKIESVKEIAPKIFKMTVRSPYVAENSKPGQFVNVKCCEGMETLLRRPISICSVDKKNSTFDIVFQIKGLGTEILSKKLSREELDIIGPLGEPFKIKSEYKKIAVIGGGIGIFPLLNLLENVEGVDKDVFLGFRNKKHMVLIDRFEKNSKNLAISTDDGSFGHKGMVVELLKNSLEKRKYDIIYTCGPIPMIKAVLEIAKENNIRCQVSLEQRMGCGIGACLVCACKIKADTEDGYVYKHVCKDGPIFWGEEVMFDD